MEDLPADARAYVCRLLEAYRTTPGTAGVVRRPDRILAAQLHQRGVALEAVENAFVLAAVRRTIRPNGAPPLGTIRSLAYFLPVIEEVLSVQPSTTGSLLVSTDVSRPLASRIGRNSLESAGLRRR
jgi:hypothetical protein